jgi:hypothetical protein
VSDGAGGFFGIERMSKLEGLRGGRGLARDGRLIKRGAKEA